MTVLESSNSKHSGDKSTVSAKNSNSLQQRRHRQEFADNKIAETEHQFETPETAPEQTRVAVSAQRDLKSTKLTTYSEASADTMASCQIAEKLPRATAKTSHSVRNSVNTTNVSNGISGSRRFSNDTEISQTQQNEVQVNEKSKGNA